MEAALSDFGISPKQFLCSCEVCSPDGVVHGIHVSPRCLVRALEALFGFGNDDTERNRVEVHTHVIHAESNQSNFLPAPVEGTIRVPLSLPFAVLCARHIIQHTSGGESRETITELMPHTKNLMPVHVKAVIGVIVARE